MRYNTPQPNRNTSSTFKLKLKRSIHVEAAPGELRVTYLVGDDPRVSDDALDDRPADLDVQQAGEVVLDRELELAIRQVAQKSWENLERICLTLQNSSSYHGCSAIW